MFAHLTFVALDLLHAHTGVRRDRENQLRDLHCVRLPVIRIAVEADRRVLRIAAEDERARADRILVDIGSFAGLQQLVRVFTREDRRVFHRQILDERCVDFLQRELDRVRVDLFDAGDQLVEAHVREVRELDRVSLTERLVRVQHALEREHHVVRVEFARRLEERGGLELHAVAQMERVGLAVRRDVPLFCQARLDFRAAAFEFDEAVINGERVGREVDASRVLGRVETRWTAF
jgi:hypothetical protein